MNEIGHSFNLNLHNFKKNGSITDNTSRLPQIKWIKNPTLVNNASDRIQVTVSTSSYILVYVQVMYSYNTSTVEIFLLKYI